MGRSRTRASGSFSQCWMQAGRCWGLKSSQIGHEISLKYSKLTRRRLEFGYISTLVEDKTSIQCILCLEVLAKDSL